MRNSACVYSFRYSPDPTVLLSKDIPFTVGEMALLVGCILVWSDVPLLEVDIAVSGGDGSALLGDPFLLACDVPPFADDVIM